MQDNYITITWWYYVKALNKAGKRRKELLYNLQANGEQCYLRPRFFDLRSAFRRVTRTPNFDKL